MFWQPQSAAHSVRFLLASSATILPTDFAHHAPWYSTDCWLIVLITAVIGLTMPPLDADWGGQIAGMTWT
jgi:hypothetical protein